MSRRRSAGLVAAVSVLLALALIGLLWTGRSERTQWFRVQNEGMAGVLATVRPRFNHPNWFRHGFTFACLIWSTKDHPYGLELCFNPSGYVVEAIRRRPYHAPRVWTLRPDSDGARVHVDPLVVARLLDRLGAQKGSLIVTGTPDLGPG